MDNISYNTRKDKEALYMGAFYSQADGPWTLYKNKAILPYVLSIADTPYRKRMALGIESLSGNTLQEGASNRREYQESAKVFIQQLERMGVKCAEVRACRSARVLMLG